MESGYASLGLIRKGGDLITKASCSYFNQKHLKRRELSVVAETCAVALKFSDFEPACVRIMRISGINNDQLGDTQAILEAQ